MHYLQDLIEPKSYKIALKILHWKNAMDEEMEALYKNHTWDLVTRPRDINIIGSKWIFKIKLKEDGTIKRYKARYSQVEGLD